MSELARKVIEQSKKDKKIKIIKKIHGKNAVCCIKSLFFGENSSEARTWAQAWNNYEKSRSIMIVYERKKIKNKVIGFKFTIGSLATGSVLGQEHDYEKGLKVLEHLKKCCK
tara:strand:+ start:144 stop:479 length:336 start_codon:yes stop_codon:yes gene_type:complete